MLRHVSPAVVVVLLASAGLVACSGAEPTRLRVEVAGLPPDIEANVAVAGPEGTSYTITATDERRVPPGVYTITIESARGSDITLHPADDQYEVVVEPQRTTTTAAAYEIAIPDTTEVLDPDDSTIVEVRDLEIVFAADSPQAAALQPGDHLISGEGERVPHLLVRRVAAVTTSGDEIVVDTEPATFDEALPAGVIRFDAVDGLTIMRPASFSTAASSDPLAEVSFSLSYRDGACSTAEGAPRSTAVAGSIRYQLDDIDLAVDGEFSWNGIIDPSVSVSAGASLTLDQNVEATIEAAVRCAVTAEREVHLGCDSVLARIVRIGPVRLECTFKIVGEAFVETSASWITDAIEAQTIVGFEAGYHSHGGGFHTDPTLDTELTSQEPTAPQHESSFGATLGFQVGLTGEDPVGVASLTIALEINAGPTVTSEPTEFRGDFDATPKVVARARLGRGFLEWNGEAEVALPGVEFNLWRTTRTSPPPSAPPSPMPPSSPTPRVEIPAPFVGSWLAQQPNQDSGEIHDDGTAQFIYRYRGQHGEDTEHLVLDMTLRSDGDSLVGSVTRATVETYLSDDEVERLPSPYHIGDDVRIEQAFDEYTIFVMIGGEPFGTFCSEQAPVGPLCPA